MPSSPDPNRSDATPASGRRKRPAAGGEPANATPLAHAADGETTGFLLYQAHLTWQRALGRAFAALGITHAQFAILAAAWQLGQGGQLPNQREVADTAHISPVVTSSTIKTLTQRGLLERVADQSDGRASQIKITDAGIEVAQAAAQALSDAEASFFDSAPNHTALVEGLKSVLAHAAHNAAAG
ncbi:MarR family transcriptional regulator [Streptomyces sp. NPDC008092]|uniref:MarR family winged helix-turn-helix transcriptional regulator n=1 Tax=Streptomyces sp. NPDC008092 TaxID=3364808 RepID=UPI0036E4FFE2